MGEVDPLVSVLIRAVVIYGAVVLWAGASFQFYRRETKSAIVLLAMSLFLGSAVLTVAL